LFVTNRARGALWSWVEQPGVGHTFDGLADELVLPFMAEAIRLRYPAGQMPTAFSGVTLLDVVETDGWLANQSTWKSGLTQIAAYDEYVGNKQTAGWLLNENVAYLYRAFSTYNRDVELDFADPLQFPGPGEWQVNVGVDPPTMVKLKIDLAATPGWTKLELLNYAQTVLERTPATVPESMLTLDVPILRRGVYGFSALVTLADGHTLSTSNVLEYSAIPEPTTIVAFAIGALTLSTWRRHGPRYSRFGK
jgi:hypothetical protein